MIKNTALVLEGGGFRGMFTAGILEVLLDKEIFFESVYGVSAGASYGVSYISKQLGRNIAVNEYIGDKRYCSINNLIKEGSLFSWDFIFGEIPQRIVPFDYDALKKSDSKFYAGTSNCITGETEFILLNEADKEDFKTILAASCSLPFIAPPVSFKGKLLMDGGLTDSVPFEYALQNGTDRVAVILTHPSSFVREPLKYSPLIKLFYRKYPKVFEMLKNRAEQYNSSISRLEELEKQGRAFVIRPEDTLQISRLENKPSKAAKVYEYGMQLAEKILPAFQEWINQKE